MPEHGLVGAEEERDALAWTIDINRSLALVIVGAGGPALVIPEWMPTRWSSAPGSGSVLLLTTETNTGADVAIRPRISVARAVY